MGQRVGTRRNDMDENIPATKDILLETAGELFANAGLEGVSIRKIAQKAGANIAAIHYHFGSKDNLYLEVVRHVMHRVRCTLAGQYLADRAAWQDKPSSRAKVICALVEERMVQFFPDPHPGWYGRLFMRMLLNPTPALGKLAEEIILPDFEQLTEVFRLCKPGMSLAEARCWTDTLLGQLGHYVFSAQFVQYMPNQNRQDADFQNMISRHLSRLLLKGLDLPLPDFLKDDTLHAK